MFVFGDGIGLTQQVGTTVALETAAPAVVIAAAANNPMKGICSVVFGSETTGRITLAALSALGIISVAIILSLWPRLSTEQGR